MIERVLEEIKNKNITISQWMIGFIGIVFIRFLFESLSSRSSTGIIPSDPYTLVHYGLFFLCLVLGTLCIVGYFSKDYKNPPKIILFALPVIWLAPIVDIFLSHGRGYKMTYIFDTGSGLIFDFFTFFGPSLAVGATYGMRVGIALILIGTGWYLWRESKSIFLTFFGIISVYLFGFLMGSLPGLIYTFSHLNSGIGTFSDVLSYFEKIIAHSTIAHNTLHDGTSSVTSLRFFELGFDKLLSQILFIMSCFFGGLLFWKMNPQKFFVVLKNCRLERVSSYIAILVSGMGFAYINRFGNPFIWIDLFGIVCILISWISLWMYAVHVNDIADIEIDKISNSDRPLIKKELNSEFMQETGYVWLAVALLGSWSVGYYPFFMSLVYIAASYIYSAPPLRLRRFPLVSSFLISVACLATILSGFFFISVQKQIQAFPPLLAVGIIIMVTLAINVKDMKDISGDKADGILTLPILFGENGPKVVGLCFALCLLLVPIFLSFYLLYIFSIPCAFIGYKLITKKPYREEPLFVLRFIFLACVAVSYLGIYWLINFYNLI